MPPKPIILQNALKQYSHDQEKIVTPQETVRHFKQRLETTGLQLLENVVRVDGGRLGIPVYFSICGSDAYNAIGNYKQMGKGATPAQAQASAVMELGERFSLFSFYRNPQNFTITTASALKGPALAANWIARSVGDTSSDLPIALELFRELPLNWTWAYNLTRNESVMLPFNWFFTINEFNGASAGNCNEEAICQGICEVVERHVSARISRRKQPVPSLHRESIQDPVALELIGKYQAAGIELYLSDFTDKMGIPTIGALAWDPSTFPHKSEIVWTAGTMPDPSKALCRALTEVAQLAGDFNSSGNYMASGLPKIHAIDEARYVTHPGNSMQLSTLPNLGDLDIKNEISNCLNALAEREMDVFVVDVRHPQLDIPAFYTIIPGTQFRERAAQSSVAMICAKIAAETLPPREAAGKLKRFEDLLPDKYYIQFYLGQIQLQQGHCEEAGVHFGKAVDMTPPAEDLASILTYWGIAYKERGKFHEALGVLKKAEQVDAERTDTLNLMGFCHYKLQDHEQAVACFKKVVALNPSSAIDYANLAVNYRALGKKAKAIEYYQLALALDDSIDFAREHLAQMGA